MQHPIFNPNGPHTKPASSSVTLRETKRQRHTLSRFVNPLTGPVFAFVFVFVFVLVSCTLQPASVSIEGSYITVDASLDSIHQNAEAVAILAEYQQRVIDVQAPVLGTSPTLIERGRPEGLLNNFEADVLREAGASYCEQPIDVAVANYGGIRNSWPKGDITVGDVYRAFPFENCLAILTLNGSQLRRLFAAIAHAGGHPISGAALVITPDGELVTCDVNGRPIDDKAIYRIATLDYLAEGNDGMDVFSEATDIVIYPEQTIRYLVTEKIKALTASNQQVAPTLDGRITVLPLDD